jgi:hypothetical protein
MEEAMRKFPPHFALNKARLLRLLDRPKLLGQITANLPMVLQDDYLRGRGDPPTPDEILDKLIEEIAFKAKRPIGAVNLSLQIVGSAEATVWHPAHGEKSRMISGMTRLVGTMMYQDESERKLFVKWVSHPFHQYGIDGERAEEGGDE